MVITIAKTCHNIHSFPLWFEHCMFGVSDSSGAHTQ
jgi:hypothetical protein